MSIRDDVTTLRDEHIMAAAATGGLIWTPAHRRAPAAMGRPVLRTIV